MTPREPPTIVDRRERRRAARSRRRIIATAIEQIAARGLAGATLQTIAAAAGVSPGLVIFHFKSKESLFMEVLEAMGEPYREGWRQAIEAPGVSAAERLLRAIAYDIAYAAAHPHYLSVWHAFWGEPKGSALYQAVSAWRDRACLADMEALIAEMTGEGAGARRLAEALFAMIMGYWLMAHVAPGAFRRDDAMASFRRVLSALFPQHYPRPGVVAPPPGRHS